MSWIMSKLDLSGPTLVERSTGGILQDFNARYLKLELWPVLIFCFVKELAEGNPNANVTALPLVVTSKPPTLPLTVFGATLRIPPPV